MSIAFIALIDSLRRNGRITAKESTIVVVLQPTSILTLYWTTAVGKAEWYVANGGWPVLHHIWQHYLFTQDKEFLKKNYSILKEASLSLSTTSPQIQ